MYFVDSNCDLYTASVTAVICAISLYIGSRYNGTRLYIYIYIYEKPAISKDHLYFVDTLALYISDFHPDRIKTMACQPFWFSSLLKLVLIYGQDPIVTCMRSNSIYRKSLI